MSDPKPSQVLAQRWFQKAENDLLNLDQYSVEIRYPQEYGEMPDEEEVQAAVEAAHTIRAWVRHALKLEDADA